MNATNENGPDGRNVEAACISEGNRCSSEARRSDAPVRCIRCRRVLSSVRSIRHEAGRQCRLLLEQEVAAC